jgi:hypothetical protein
VRCHVQMKSDREDIDPRSKEGVRYFTKLEKRAAKSKMSADKFYDEHRNLMLKENKQREEVQLVSPACARIITLT